MSFFMDMESKIEKIMDSASEVSIQYDGNDEDEPWIVLLNGAYLEDEEENSEIFRGAEISDAVDLAYKSITEGE